MRDSKIRQGLEWAIDHEWQFALSASFSVLASRNQLPVGLPMNIVAEWLGRRFPEFDPMNLAIDRLREPVVGRSSSYGSRGALSDSISRMGLSLQKKDLRSRNGGL